MKWLRLRMHRYLVRAVPGACPHICYQQLPVHRAELTFTSTPAAIPALFCLPFGLRSTTRNSANILRKRPRQIVVLSSGKFTVAPPICFCVDNPLGPSNDWYSITSCTSSVSSSFDSLSGCVGWIDCCCPPPLCCRGQALPTLASFRKRIALCSFGRTL
jgi:hypothetical protein